MENIVISIDQIIQMLNLQNEMNCVVNSNWRRAGYNWRIAILAEAVEAIDHHQWKWWKERKSPDMPQLRIELIDIWHFALSLMLQSTEPENHVQVRQLAESIIQQITTNRRSVDCCESDSLLQLLQKICGIATEHEFNIRVFSQAIQKAGMTWDDLYRIYIGKHCLNIFRQEHGYKNGTYIKNWSSLAISNNVGRSLEDNDHLNDILDSEEIDKLSPENVRSFILDMLNVRYEYVISNPQTENLHV